MLSLLVCHSFCLSVNMSTFSPVPDYIKSTVTTIWAIHQDERPGDILAFLTGQVCDTDVLIHYLGCANFHWQRNL